MKRRNRELHVKILAKSNARDETFLEGMNIFRENEKMKLEDHLLLRIEISLEIEKRNVN